MQVLLIEKKPNTSQFTEMWLKQADLNVHRTNSEKHGIGLAKSHDYDIILLDLSVPDMSGHAVLMNLRTARVETPVMILSDCNDPKIEISALNSGADDYLTKPLHLETLVARMHAIVRRSKGHAQSVILIGQISINLNTKTVEVGGKPVQLARKEYQIFELLSIRKGTIVTKKMFLDNLYGGMNEPLLKIIHVLVCKIRKKLSEATGGEHYIETVRSHGYILCGPKPSIEMEAAELGQDSTMPSSTL